MNLSELSFAVYDAIAYIFMAFLFFYLGKLFYQLLHPSFKVKEELVQKDNLAFALAHVGYFIGLLLAIGSSIIGPTRGLMHDLLDIAVFGSLAVILLNVSVFITEHLLLRKFSVKKEIIEDRNAGTGIIEGAVSVSSGLILMGAVTGESSSLWEGIYTAVIFWVIGQTALLIASWIYNRITPFDVHEHIEKDNVAVGIGYAGALIAMANLIHFGLKGEFTSWGETLSEAGLEVLVGLLLLPVMRYLTDKILLPGENLTDELINQEKPNIGAAIIEAFSYIGGSVLITWCL